MERKYMKVTPSDTVLVALADLPTGMEIRWEGTEFTLTEPIPKAHKFALTDIAPRSDVIKYGSPIGAATQHIQQGSWVHTHNLKTKLEGLLDYAYNPSKNEFAGNRSTLDSFMGYRRDTGLVGTRNEIWIIPTVSCVNHTTDALAKAATARFGDCCDGILSLPHNTGCSQMGDDAEISQQILKGIVQHPNAGGVLLVSLGCENNDLDHFLPVLGSYDNRRLKTMVTQEIVGDEIEAGLALIEDLLQEMKDDQRSEVPASELIVGLKCGGSDAFSGLTANPLCGHVSDRLVDHGGIGILTEVPEMFGAEQYLMDRADSRQTFDRIVSLINSFKHYYLDCNMPIYENPSPGNKAGGISTLEEKSLGNIQKSGSSPITDTLTYGQRGEKPGINLLEGPGNDNVSITNLLASGAQIILFTTGRGNPLASIVPTIKVSSNSTLANNKPNWIDYDAGKILNGTSFADATEELWKLVLDIASGKKTKGELNKYRAIMVFKKGVLL